MLNTENENELKARLSALSPAKRAWLEQRLRTSLKKRPGGKIRAEVVQLQAGSGKLPVYFIYAGPSEIVLAQTMGTGHSIFGIEMPWPLSWRDAAVNNKIAALPTMEKLVAPFVAALSAHVGSSPCVLAGYSFAGVMAFEAAHQLQRLGGKVEMVMLLDTLLKLNVPSPLDVAWYKKLSQRWKQTLDRVRADWSERLVGSRLRRARLMLWWILVKGTKRISRLFWRPSLGPDVLTSLLDEQGMPLRWSLINRLYQHAKELYEPRLLNCRGILFRASPESKEYFHAPDDSFGWKGLFAKGLEIIPVTGDHQSLIRDKLFQLTLARKMTEVLRNIR